MGFDRWAIAGHFWKESASTLSHVVASFGYADNLSPIVSVGGITDSVGDDLLDSEGNVIFDSLVSDPSNPFGITSILTNGYWNSVTSELNARVASFGYLGTFASPSVWLVIANTKSWLALNSRFRMR